MSENKKIENPEFEVKDEELDDVVGGFFVKPRMKAFPCKGGCGRMLSSADQYCDSCRSKLNGQGVTPIA